PPPRGGRPPAPECLRRQKRRELDARRSKCRIRIGGHLERWCRLKEQLGFALHSQLAQFLLDRYSSHGCTWSPGRCSLPVPRWHPVVRVHKKFMVEREDSCWVGCWRSTWSCSWIGSSP
ncbi:PREDICTED: zinc finger protein 692-like, partial [Ficedula albicollis]|uniref:zinc finger protein 692-like n=1 Tax=Ficedula albicollis TaxID=59894 RepID=UPI0007AD8148